MYCISQWNVLGRKIKPRRRPGNVGRADAILTQRSERGHLADGSAHLEKARTHVFISVSLTPSTRLGGHGLSDASAGVEVMRGACFIWRQRRLERPARPSAEPPAQPSGVLGLPQAGGWAVEPEQTCTVDWGLH